MLHPSLKTMKIIDTITLTGDEKVAVVMATEIPIVLKYVWAGICASRGTIIDPDKTVIENIKGTWAFNVYGQQCKCGNTSEELHPCPYKQEMCEDENTLCNCCKDCQHECCMDV